MLGEWVDFYWEVDGKVYEFSIPGGGFVSLEHLVEVLGITGNDSQLENEDEAIDNTADLDETKDGNGSYGAGNETSTNDWNIDEETADVSDNVADENPVSDNNSSIVGESYDIIGVVKPSVVENITYREAINLNDVEVSEETKIFTADIVSLEFSSPELVDVSRVETDITIGELRENRGLECEYSMDLTQEQIEEINAQTVTAGDWVLISLKPFDTDEILTVTMKNGETFEIRVTDVAYQGTKVTNPNGKTVALLNLSNNNALQSTAHSVSGRLQATEIQVNGNRITSVDPLTTWTFTRVPNTTDRYYIQASNGYLNLNGNNGNVTISSQQQAFTVQQKSDGTIRIKHTDNNYAINNHSNSTANGYGGYDSNWDSNPGEWFTMYEISDPIIPHVTVHYVLRDGTELTGVEYTGSNPLVVKNADGTFTIPYDWGSGQTSDTSVDFRTQFALEGYTYANTHLAGKDANGDPLTYDGYMIDSVLTRSGSNLEFKSDSGATSPGPWNNPPQGNLYYSELTSFSLSGNVNARPTVDGDRITYATSGNKDIYVILDPVPTGPSGGGAGTVDPGAVEAPSLKKTMEDNEDGTYTLSLKVDAHAVDAEETNKANVLFIVDTSSSMRATTTDNRHNRIMDTHDAVLDLGQRLLAYNDHHPDSVEVSMITFDGGVEEPLDWTTDKTAFQTAVNDRLVYKYLHTGTDWEDSLKAALKKLKEDTDNDPTFVIFFTDGEPSQYTSFHGSNKNSNADPTGTYTGENDPGDGYSDFFSFFLCREASKDEMRAIVDTGAQLYGIYAYNPKPEDQNPPRSPYNSYLGSEGGKELLHNALKYGYNTSESLEGNLFYEVKSTNDLQGAFDRIFNLITEKVGFSNVVVTDGISAGVTSSTVLNGDVSAFTYTVRDKSKTVAYKVTVAPNGAPEGTDEGKPIFWIGGNGPPVVGEIREVSTTKILTDDNGNPILDQNNKIQTHTINVEVYYYKDADENEYIMPIAVPDQTVTWDLSPFGILKDGYSYQVDFVVWPNQDAYDLVADLNNGKRTDLEAAANWEAQPLKTDSNGRKYRQGGFADYPYISRYEDNGVYSAMSNTEQNVEYYKIDNKIVNGQQVTEITGPYEKAVEPPDPMPLTASLSRIEKLWNYERNPALFAQYLYNTDGSSKGFVVDFDVFQGDNLTTPYTSESLGWVYDLDANGHPIYLGENPSGDYVIEEDEDTHTQLKVKGHYVWAPNDTMSNIIYAEHAHQIGTRWVTDFSIATGLMLTEEEMNTLGLNKSKYPSTVFGEGTDRKTYYILEPGHDYTIKEHQTGTIGYEFDFTAPVYHPMLIDGVLKNVEITYTYKTDEHGKTVIDTATISSITGSDAGLSGLEVDNTLRGYINLNKVVVDEDNQPVESDNTKFEYTIKLESSLNPGPFEGTHIPWYGINGLYYNNGTETYYQVYEDTGGIWKIKNEAGEEYPLTSTGFDPDDAGEQTVTYEVDGHEKQLTLYGNQMTATSDGKTATATLAITQNETLYIANVPKGTKYTITETDQDEYVLVDILKEVKNGSNVEKSEHVTGADLGDRKAIGTIVTNRDNHVTYTNKVLTGGLNITKTIQKNGSRDTSATGKFYYAVYDEVYNPNADPAQTPVRTGSINVTANGTATVTEENLKIGTYYVYELTGENGTPVTSGGIFNSGKYFAVTTTGSPATVEYGGTSTVDIINNYETISVTATKTWADNNPENLTVYFKLFYKSSGGIDVTTGTPLEPLASGVTSVTWPDMPKYDETGSEYTYIVREYVLDEEHGELAEGGHKYTEAAPNGYVNTEVGLSVTNTKLETYEPVTTYSGLKLWVDTVNGGLTRPDRLNVTLMIDKEPYDNTAGDVPALDKNGQPYQLAWVTIDEDEWRYTFHNLPVFDEEMKIIRYYAVETPVAGYDDTITNHSDTQYVYMDQYNTFGHTENDADIDLSSDADLAYVAVRIQHEGYLHHIWTQRVPTDEEKIKLIQFVNQDLSSQGLGNPAATVDNTHWVSGLPIDHEFVYSPRDQGAYKIKLTRTGTKRIHLEVNKHEVFSNICYGTLKYNYTSGSTDFKNELQPVSYSVEKNWADDEAPPKGSVITAELQGKVTRKVDPQPEGQTEPQYETVRIDLASVGVTQKIQVTLNGGAEGGDDTTTNPWKYTWSNLPPCDKAGNEITYSVKEISYTIGGHTVNLNDFVPTEDSSSTPGTTIITNKIPAYSFNILKIDEGSAAALIGAKFTIREIQPASDVTDPTYVGTASASTPETTGSDGRVSFNNIPLGYYEVEEKELPPGYVLTQDQDGKFYIRVDTDSVKLLEKVITDGKLSFKEVLPGAGGRIKLGNVELTKTGNLFVLTVENTSGAALPYTGGPGTKLFTIIGSLLIAFAGLLLWRRRRTI